MAEYQIAANGRDDELGHSFLPEFKRFERFGITLPFNITPQGDIKNNGWTTFSVPDIFDRVLSINLAAPSKTAGAWIAEKLVDELVFTSDDHIVQRISADYIRFWYQGLSQARKSLWDKMTSSTQVGERVYLDLPFAFTQDTSSAIIPWMTLKLHVKWSNRVESLVDTGEVILNTRNILLDRDKYDKTKGDDPLQVMEKYNDTRQLVIQSYEQIDGGYSTSASTFMELRGPCKDVWFGLKANADFSAHTSDVVTDDLYIIQNRAAVPGSWTLGTVDNSDITSFSTMIIDNTFSSNFGPYTLNPSSAVTAGGVIGDLDVTLTAVILDPPGTSTSTAFINPTHGIIVVAASGDGWLPGDTVTFSTTALVAAGFQQAIGNLELTITASMLTGYVSAQNLGITTQPHQSLGVVRLDSNALGQTITAANIKVNDDTLFAEQKAGFFNQVIPYYRYKGCAAPGFYYYSFALKPQEYQPSGTFNFSRVSSKYLNITNTPYDSNLHILSNRYNITDRNTPVYLD